MQQQEIPMQTKSAIGTIISWLAGLLFLAIGLINCFWGNDLGYGLFVILLSLIFFTPVTTLVRNRMGFNLPLFLKVLVGIFIIWSAMGVGELPDKVDMMLADLSL